VVAPSTETIARILELVEDGVIEADNPVSAVKVVEAVVNVSVLVTLTTCSTVPYG
jgi:hypothetical protein